MSVRGRQPNSSQPPQPLKYLLTGSYSYSYITHIHPSIPKTFACLHLTHHFQITIPPPRPHPHHNFLIPVAAAPLLPSKSLLMWPSAVVQMPPAATTYSRAFPPPLSPSHLHITGRYSLMPPTLTRLPASCQCSY